MEDTPNTTVIELSAVNKVKDSLFRTEHVEPDIRDNDKTPSWDGELRVYREKSFAKNCLSGRIPVQIKGQWVPKLNGNTIKYSVDTIDLRNYLNDFGVMFFIVQMKDFDHYKIYYSSLLPFDLRRILDDAQDQKSKQVTLQHFPLRSPNKVLRILFDFLSNKNKQGQLLPNIRSLQDLRATDMEIENFEFGISPIGLTSEDELMDTLLGSPLYLYAKPKKINASFVVDKIFPEEISDLKNVPIFVDGEQLYDSFSVVRMVGKKRQIRIGSCIFVEVADKTLQFSYTFEETLHRQTAELKLLSAMVQGLPVQIGSYLTEGENLRLKGNTVEEIVGRLEELKKISHTLSLLHIKKDLQLSTLSEREYKMLHCLMRGIDGKSVPFNINGNPGAGVLTIANVRILLNCKQSEAGNQFFISDFFTSSALRLAEVGQSVADGVPISPYVLMNCDALKSIDNIVFENIVSSIRAHPFSAPYGIKITCFILELLKFYDSEHLEELTVLDIANELVDFLLEHDENERALHQINKLQILKRKRPLCTKEVGCLISMKGAGAPPQIQLAASILLESFQEANLIYDNLPSFEQQNFDEYPIVRLWTGHCSAIADNHGAELSPL